MARRFWDLLKIFCKQSTILGLKYFYIYPDRISRCFWTINLVAVLGLASMLTMLLWNRFREMPTRITIENQYSSVLELPYPAITICSPNQMTLPNVKHFKRTLVDGNLTLDFEKELPQLLGYYEQVAWTHKDVLEQLQKLIDINRHDIQDVMSSLPQSCEEFLIQCLFEMVIIDCKLLFKPILTPHGLCCIFNSPYYLKKSKIYHNPQFQPKKPKGLGVFGGLTVVTDYQPEVAVIGTLRNIGAIQMLFNDWTEFPSDDESTLVHPNVETFQIIRGIWTYCSEEVSALSVMSRKCVFEHEHRLEYFKEYHNSNCDLECFIREVTRRCHCVPFFMPFGSRQYACDVTTVPCIMHTRSDLTHPNSSVMRCDCPRDCVSRVYKVDSNIGNLNAHKHLVFDHYFENVTITNSSTILHLYFGDPFYTQMKQETVMSLINLTSNLGGVFGMCLGCSVVSVLEILFFIYKAAGNARKGALAYRRRNGTRAVGDHKL